MVMVRRRYADGGKVVKSDEKQKADEARAAKPSKKPALPSSVLGTGALAKSAEAIRNKRKEQEEALGLRDGGMVRNRSGKRGKRC